MVETLYDTSVANVPQFVDFLVPITVFVCPTVAFRIVAKRYKLGRIGIGMWGRVNISIGTIFDSTITPQTRGKIMGAYFESEITAKRWQVEQNFV